MISFDKVNAFAALTFSAVLPQFVNRSTGAVIERILLIVLLLPTIALVCDSLWTLAAGTARTLLAHTPRRLALLGGTGWAVMIGLGAALAITGRKDWEVTNCSRKSAQFE